MVTFLDVLNFKYDEQEVDKDIKFLLQTGKFNPSYDGVVREFLKPEIVNCQK